jgi:hypothetical protein
VGNCVRVLSKDNENLRNGVEIKEKPFQILQACSVVCSWLSEKEAVGCYGAFRQKRPLNYLPV